MANGIDWANILNLKGEPTFEERWASSLAEIGIFPTEKIYGKDIQTPTIGIEPGDVSEGWAALSPEERERVERRNREINKRWALEQEENRKRKIEEERIKREKEQYGGVTFEEYKRRIQAGWKFNPRGAVAGGGKWITPRLAAPAFGAPKYEAPTEDDDYAPLTNYDKEVSKFMRTKEYNSMTPGDKLNFYKTTQNDRNKIKDGIDKKLTNKAKVEADADEDIDFAELWQVIKDVNAGRATSAELAIYLKSKKVSEDLFNSIMEEIPEPPTAVETEEIATSKAVREQKRKENELVDEWADEYPWLRLSDKKAGLFQGALEAKRRYDLDEDEQVFRQTLDTGKETFKQEQATTKHQEWGTERQDKLDALEVKKEQWTLDFGAERAQELFDNEMTTLDYLEKVRAAESNEAITKDRDLKNYTIAGIKEEHSWVQAIHTMGIKDKEFVQSAYEFVMNFDFNKVKEETRSKEFGQTYRLDVTKEAAIQDRFTKEFTLEMDRLNNKIAVDWADLELRGDIEQRISTMAMLNYTRLVKELGVREAEVEIKKLSEQREWWLQGEELRLDNEEAQLKFIETMSKIANDATKVGIQQALANASMTNMSNRLQFDYAKLAQDSINKGTSPIRISPSLSVTLGNMSSEMQDEVTRWMKTVYDEDKGFYHPKPEEWEKINNFLFGKEEGETRPQERFGVNLDVDEYVRGCAGQFDWSDQMKGWCTVTRDKEFMWEKVEANGAELGVFIAPDIEEAIKKPGLLSRIGRTLGGIGETLTRWFTFTEPVAPGIERVMKAIPTGNLETDAQNVLTERGGETPWSEILSTLTSSPFNYTETEVRVIFGR